MESISDPKQVTVGDNDTQNSTDIDTWKFCEEENVGEKGDDNGDYYIDSPNILGLVCVSRYVEEIIGTLSGTTY